MQPLFVLIGRFQPFHAGHARLLSAALAGGGDVVVVLGSHGRHRSPRNPFTSFEREVLIRSTLSSADQERVHVITAVDHLYDESRWRREVRAGVERWAKGRPIHLVGLRKDRTSAYLGDFPDWPLMEVPGLEGISGCDIRAAWLEGRKGWDTHLASPVRDWLLTFQESGTFAWLKDEHQALEAYRQRWSGAPYAPVLVTVDMLVTHQDAVLLVTRGRAPGQGTWAFPGGFLDAGERLAEAARRELSEETGLSHVGGRLAGMKPAGAFDHPLRSERGRMISHVFRLELSDGPRPQVKGGDDAASAHWVPLPEALAHPERFFDDHHEILSHLTARRALEQACSTPV